MMAPPLPFIPEEAHGKPIVMALMAYAGPLAEAEGVFAPFRALAQPVADLIRPLRYPELFEGPAPEVRYASATNSFTDSIDGDGAQAIVEQLKVSTAMMKAVQLRVLGGAYARVPTDATAFAHRDRPLFVNVATMYMDPAEKPVHDEWVSNLGSILTNGDPGGYVGFHGDVDEARVRAAYPGPTWDRLREAKRRYDPANFFRVNHNIPPAGDEN
jgi:hypothetical protein